MDKMIKIRVRHTDGSIHEIEGPTDMGLSLMELLKASEYDVLATCGGMALCATCCVDVLEGEGKLPIMNDDEYAMIDTLPDALHNSRLACQLKLNSDMDNILIQLHHENA
jgi:2Fe-2S ferredoxin